MGNIINLIKTAASVCQGTSNLIYKHGTGQASVYRVSFNCRYWYRGSLPSTDYFSLGPANSNIIANHNELDMVCLFGMERSVLLLCQTKVENIAGVIPDSEILINRQEALQEKKNTAYLTMITVLGGKC